MTSVLQVLATALVSAVLVGNGVSRRQRRRLSLAGATFPCQIWWLAGSAVGRGDRSGIRRAKAVWVHDVLLVQQGRLFPRLLALAVRLPEDSIRFAAHGEATRLGHTPLVLELRLDDGALVAVAAASRHRTLLAGPFLAAAMATLRPHPD
jgi:hypothetical protein